MKVRCVLKWLAAGVVRNLGVLRLLERSSAKSIRILLFHRISLSRRDDGVTVSVLVFRAQIKYLLEHHPLVSLDEALLLLRGERPFVGGEVAITFDDGYRDNYDLALPTLSEHHVPATIFLAVGAVDGESTLWTEQLAHALQSTSRESVDLSALGCGIRSLQTKEDRQACLWLMKARLKERMDAERQQVLGEILRQLQWQGAQNFTDQMFSWDMVKAVRKDGFTIGAHTVSHRILTRIPLREAEWEITESKQRIERHLGEPVRHFAYPNGTQADWDPKIKRLVRRAGFETASTTVRGCNVKDADPYALRRIEITDAACTDPFGRFSPEMFAAQLVGLFRGWER